MKKQTLHFAAMALLLSIFVSSCTNYRYTNYGKPLDFLHAKKYKAQPQGEETVSNSETTIKEEMPVKTPIVTESKNEESTPEVAVVAEKEEVKTTATESKAEVVETNNEVASTTVEEQEVVNEETIKEEVKANKRDIKRSFKSIRNTSHNTGGDDILIILLCIFIPPLAVFLVLDLGKEFWIDLLLWVFLFGIGGIIYAFIVCF